MAAVLSCCNRVGKAIASRRGKLMRHAFVVIRFVVAVQIVQTRQLVATDDQDLARPARPNRVVGSGPRRIASNAAA